MPRSSAPPSKCLFSCVPESETKHLGKTTGGLSHRVQGSDTWSHCTEALFSRDDQLIRTQTPAGARHPRGDHLVEGSHATWTALPRCQNQRWAACLTNNRSLPGERKAKGEGERPLIFLPKGRYSLTENWLRGPELPRSSSCINSRNGMG